MKSRLTLSLFATFTALGGCSGQNSPGNPLDQGGVAAAGDTGTGGAVGTGGAQSSAVGETGGHSNVGSTSGGPSTGGVSTSGGTGASSGGTGATGQGGTSATTGGASVGRSGGTSSTGGAATGGNASTGGANTGGATSTSVGGAGGLATGGKSSTGGANAGGATSTSAGGTGGSATGGKSSTGGANTGGDTSAAGASSTHWVGTWTASPYYDSANQPPASLANAVLRQVAHVSLGGSEIRVQFSNLFGNGAVTINSAHIALCKATPAVDNTIDTATDKALAFSGKANVTIAQGQEIWSDPIAFNVPNQGNITITTAFGSVPSQVVGHSGSRTTSYQQAGSSNVTAASMTSATTYQHWYYISGIDVMADASAKGVVAIGDSITDGRGTDNDRNNRWTDIMAARLQANAATANVSTMNQGIGATNLVGTGSTTAQSRFARDVLEQSGVRYAIVYDGVNDIGAGTSFASMKTVYDSMISQAHARGLLIYGATILPFSGNSYYTAAHESVRQQVNTYIKSGVFDGTIDFDAALTDGGNPPALQAAYATWAQQDWLHPGPAGYQKMGDSVALTLFTK